MLFRRLAQKNTWTRISNEKAGVVSKKVGSAMYSNWNQLDILEQDGLGKYLLYYYSLSKTQNYFYYLF